MTPREAADTARAWTVHWKDVDHTEMLAWFQASRRSGNAPAEGQEVVDAAAYDAMRVALVAAAERADTAEADAEVWKRMYDASVSDRVKLKHRAEDAEAEAATLEAALTPFVEWLEHLAWHPNQDDDLVDGGEYSYGFSYADVARARAALAAGSADSESCGVAGCEVAHPHVHKPEGILYI